MKLHEYQSKSVFARYGVPIPKGRVAGMASEAKQIAEELGSRVVVKAQVLVGGRGKAGGIRLAKSPQEAEELATHILGMEIKGMKVRAVLIDEAVTIVKEIYLGIVNDRVQRCPVMIGSSEGGMEIEEVARKNPEKIIKVAIDPLLGLRDYQARDMAVGMDLPKEYWKTFITIATGLWRAFQENDATLAEINPLVITADNRLLALDGKMVIDDNALYRHADLSETHDRDEQTPGEIEARKYGLSFIKLDGEIGCMVNGAGLAMETMDIIKLFGGSPANFLDIGGGAASEKVAAGLRIILSDANVKAVLINIFGGITRGDEVARGILSVTQEINPIAPIIVRLVGTNAEEGLRLLSCANFLRAETLVEAAQKAVKASKEGKK